MPSFTVASVNVRSNPLEPQRAVNARIREAVVQSPVVFYQEIKPARYKAAVQLIARRFGRVAYCLTRETPISVPRGVKVIGTQVRRVHGGLRRVSPDRGWGEVRTDHGHGCLVAFINLHPVSKGYVEARHRATHWQWRHDHLVAYWTAMQARVAQLHALGYTVVVGGDCNDPTPPAPHLQARVLASSGLDHLWVVPAPGWHVAVSERDRIAPNRAMDHPIISARLTLTKES